MKVDRAITLISLIVTIVILSILAGVAIASLGGENGLISRVNQAKKAQIKSEIREQLVLKLSELQVEKNGEATLDDVTQEWANTVLKDYKPIIKEDASISGKKITMSKNGVLGKYIIDEKLNIIEIEEKTGPQLTYEVKSREGENLQVSVIITDSENGLKTIEYDDGHIQNANGANSVAKDCTIQLGVEYKVKIVSNSGEEKIETILINDYYQTITKELGEGISIDNTAVKTAYNKPYQATITTEDNVIIESLIVTMDGQVVITSGNNIVDIDTGKIYIEKVTGDLEIKVTSKEIEILITETDSSKSVVENNDAYRAEYILSGGERGYSTLSDENNTKINIRYWDMYRDKEYENKQMINNVHLMNYNEAVNIEKKSIGSMYWLSNAYNRKYLYGVNKEKNEIINYAAGHCYGVKCICPVVEMQEGVYIKSGNGTSVLPYILEIEK